jgi:hypothetical protein
MAGDTQVMDDAKLIQQSEWVWFTKIVTTTLP